MTYEKKHEDFLDKLGYKLFELISMSAEDKNHFIAENLVSYICGDGTPEEEDIAEDIITMITTWKIAPNKGGEKMIKPELKEIAEETIKITDKKEYTLADGKKIELPDWDYSGVKVFAPDQLQKIEDDEDEFFERAFNGTSGAMYFVVNGDSFEVARGLNDVLVMNFANAHRPGGGFLNGAKAQEEALCRCSTLYKSISSDKAMEMYDYNNKAKNPLDSDYMLLSRDVMVFRDVKCNLLAEPYSVSVVTVPAPNRYGRASSLGEGEVLLCMKNRLRKMLFMAAREGYRSLVLGAWGCGAFGNDTKEVARTFHELFFDEGFDEFFEVVCFAILGDMEKVGIFADVFADHLDDEDYEDFLYGYSEDKDYVNDEEGIMYITTEKDLPVLNHSMHVTENNKGYAQGTIVDGTPFEVEYFTAGDDKIVAIYIPVFEEDESDEFKDPKFTTGISGFKREEEAHDNSIMDIGMVDGGTEENDAIVHAYVNYVVEARIIKFVSDIRNGTVEYRTDINGNEFAKILITLSTKNDDYAVLLTGYRPFRNAPEKKQNGKVIEFKRFNE